MENTNIIYKTQEELKIYYARNNERILCSCGKSPFKNDLYSHNKTKFHINKIDSDFLELFRRNI
jgi:CDGSH-type Zn-finger protein